MQREVTFQIEKRILGIEHELQSLRDLLKQIDIMSAKKIKICSICETQVQKAPMLNCGCIVHRRCLNIVKDGFKTPSDKCLNCDNPLSKEVYDSLMNQHTSIQKAAKSRKHLKAGYSPTSPAYVSEKKKGYSPTSPAYVSEKKKGYSPTSPAYM